METTYKIISEAREILELPESATMVHIKENYKRLIKRWHPDINDSAKELHEEKTRKIINAYKVIMTYCENYSFSFKEEEVGKYISDQERWFKQFGSDSVWAR